MSSLELLRQALSSLTNPSTSEHAAVVLATDPNVYSATSVVSALLTATTPAAEVLAALRRNVAAVGAALEHSSRPSAAPFSEPLHALSTSLMTAAWLSHRSAPSSARYTSVPCS